MDDKNEHIPLRTGRQFVGTLNYGSIFNHQGLEQSRRDDLESLGYSILKLYKKALPWENPSYDPNSNMFLRSKEMVTNIGRKKENYLLSSALHDPVEKLIIEFIQEVRALDFETLP